MCGECEQCEGGKLISEYEREGQVYRVTVCSTDKFWYEARSHQDFLNEVKAAYARMGMTLLSVSRLEHAQVALA